MITNQKHIIEICIQLTDEGKIPSVALIKNRATQPIPMPQIIQMLQKWKQSPESCKQQLQQNTSTKKENKQTMEQRVTLLEKKVEELHNMINKLLANNDRSQ